MKQVFAIKKATHQNWTKSGLRIPVTVLSTQGNVVVQKLEDNTVLGFGKKKLSRTTRPQLEMLKKHSIAFGVRVMRKIQGIIEKNAGDTVVPSDVFMVGDTVKVTGVSKGLGFAGVVKRHGFAGGPKTHGQSDRERAPGSIGNRTTPGRVFKQKRMAGRGGGKTVSVLNLKVVAVDNDNQEVWVKGVVPGSLNSTVRITKIADGKFEGLVGKVDKKEVEKVVEQVIEQVAEQVEEKAVEAAV